MRLPSLSIWSLPVARVAVPLMHPVLVTQVVAVPVVTGVLWLGKHLAVALRQNPSCRFQLGLR